MTHSDVSPIRVLFLCTQNSARSQIAEALLQRKGRGRFEAGSAGTDPAAEVHPLAVQVLQQHGLEWGSKRPKSIDAVIDEPSDVTAPSSLIDIARATRTTQAGETMMDRAGSAVARDRHWLRIVRLLLGLLLILGSVTSVSLLWVEGYSPRAMIVLGLTLMLTSACGIWFAIRGRWD